MNIFSSYSRLTFGVVATLLFIFQILSVRAADEICRIQSSQDILNCAFNHHPEVLKSQAALKRDAVLQVIAKQRPNPELESTIAGSDENDELLFDTETTFFHTVEVGGKRRARIHQALAQYQLSSTQVLESQELTALNTVLALYRLRQLRKEIGIASEAVANFGHILDQFQTRPKLTPEQNVSKSAFELALAEHQLKKITLIQEQKSLENFLESATGLSPSILSRFLPTPQHVWPKYFASTQQVSVGGSELKKAQAQLNLSQANVKVAKSNAWPDFKFGPRLETEKRITGTEVKAGVGISLPVPILSQNRGNKVYAQLDLLRANLVYDLTQKNLENERILQVSRYNDAVRACRSFPPSALNKKHEGIEDLFERGLVPSSLVIESHHQIHEVTEAFHRQELTALDALWRIRIIDGTFLQEKL